MAHESEPNPATKQAGEPSLGHLFSDLSRETTTLVRQDVALAKTEISQKAVRLGKDIGSIIAGGIVVYAGLFALVATIIIALGQRGLPWWLSALVVGSIVASVGGVLVWTGLTQLTHQSIAPQATIATLKEDVTWAKEQTA